MKTLSRMGFVCVVLLLTGCSQAINLSGFTETDLDLKQCDIQPPKYIVDRNKPRVAVLEIGDTTQFKGALSKPAQEALTQVITQGTGLQVVERSQLGALTNEIQFSADYSNPGQLNKLTKLANNVDYLVVGSVSSARVHASFTEGRSYKDKKGNVSYTSPSCSISGDATVNVRVISAETMGVFKVFPPMKGSVFNSMDVGSRYECRPRHSLETAISAVNSAIAKSQDQFQDAFPNWGYILKTMTNSQDRRSRIAYASLGTNDGLKAGDAVVISRYVKHKDRIKNTSSVTTQDLGEAVVSETDLRDDSCLLVLTEEQSKSVVPGYLAKTKSQSWYRKLGR